ncbi:alpha/beta-hydrolase [Sarocladium strictum]
MSSTKPTIVFAPGAWHLPSCFDLVKEQLEPLGYPVVGITYPSVGAEPPNKNATDDALVLKGTLKELTDLGTEIVVISHSYGGLVASNALEGFGAKQRAADGKKGGVIVNIYVTSFVIPKGNNLVDLLPNGEYLEWMRREGDYVYVNNPADIFYHDLTPEAQQQAISQLKHQSAGVYDSRATYEPWHDIPSAYLATDADRAIVPPAQAGMISILGDSALVEHVNTSHSPFLSQPRAVTDFIVKAAKFDAEQSKA